GSRRPWPGRAHEGRCETRLRLERREGLVLAVEAGGIPDPQIELLPLPGEIALSLPGPWSAFTTADRPAALPCPGDWSQAEGWGLFTGTLRFLTDLILPGKTGGQPIFLDLGRVGDIAEVSVNGQAAGIRVWPPYIMEISAACQPGVNRLEVQVTNSMANAYDGLQLPSGLLGPVALRAGRQAAL
ncbi:MAG: hypothetical protein IT210_23165, partial [Armatimonadetes bacterium]|nr:hypothetical protein [Armatimonadota bacterium]